MLFDKGGFDRCPSCCTDMLRLPCNIALASQLLQQPHVALPPCCVYRFYSCSEPKLPSFTPHQLSATLAALGGLTPDRPPPPSWASAVMQQVMSRLTDMNPPSLVDTLWGCMELKMTPHRDLAVRCVGQCAQGVGLAGVLWGIPQCINSACSPLNVSTVNVDTFRGLHEAEDDATQGGTWL